MLTIAISVSAGASAAIAYFPGLAPLRAVLAVLLVVLVGGITWFGPVGRLFFAVMTLGFLTVAATVLAFGLLAARQPAPTAGHDAGHPAVLAIALAFPVAMALATGVEAPSSAIAELGQLDEEGRRRFGRITLWLTLGIVGTLTLGVAIEAERLAVGVPSSDSTQIAELARVASPAPVFALFQLVTSLLLLSAASSSFQAGPGMLEALARHRSATGAIGGILPRSLGRTNSHHTPYLGVLFFMVVSALVVAAARGRDQELVLFYAVAVFLSFLAGLLAMAAFSLRERRAGSLVVNVVGAGAVAFTLAMNLARALPLVSIAAALAIAGGLYGGWVRAGRPGGVRHLAARARTPNGSSGVS